MQKLTRLDNSKFEIEIKLTGEETKKYIDQAIEKTIKSINEPGFRKGKMPKAMFLQKYGVQSAYPEAMEEIVNDIYPKMIEEEKLDIIDYPNFDWATATINEKDGFFVKGTVEVMPEVTLPDYAKIKESVKVKEVKVSKKEVKDVIDGMKAQDATYETKDGAESKNGDVVIIDFEGFVDGVAFEGGKGEQYSLTLGSNSFIPGFEEQLEGLKAGDSKDVVVTFPEAYQSPDLAGKEATFKCLVHDVQTRKLPKLTDDKVKEMDQYKAETVADLEVEIEEQLKEQKNNQAAAERENSILDKLVKEAKLDVPAVMVEQEVTGAVKNIEENFKAQGMGLDMYLQMTGMDMETLRGQFREDAIRRIQMHLLITEVMKKEDIKVSEKEVKDQLAQISEEYKMSEEDVMKQLGGSTDPIMRDLEFSKARDILFK